MGAILVLSGDLGSSQHTMNLLKAMLSWIPPGLSPAQMQQINALLRKTGHFLAYALMCFLWFRAFQGHLRHSLTKSCLWALGLSLAVALADEGHQSFVISRTGSLRDVALDMCGATLAALMCSMLGLRRRPTVSNSR